MTALFRLMGEFRRDERGVFAVIFGVMAIVLVALGGAVVDYVSLEQTRTRAQVALDAAALALQPEINDETVSDESIRERAEAIVVERVQSGGVAGLVAEVDQIRIDRDTGRLFLAGHFTLPTTFVRLVGVEELGASFSAEAMQGSVNMEIALALDVTGSMAGSRIRTLKAAATEFVEDVLASNGGEAVTKVALIPYSQAVNASPRYAEALRGPIRPIANISNISWSSGNAKNITAATKTNPVQITSRGHEFVVGDWIYIRNVVGMTELNNKAFQISWRDNDNFRLAGVDGRAFTTYSRNGTAIRCQVPNCDAVITSEHHGYDSGNTLYFQNIRGQTEFNNRFMAIGSATRDTFVLPGVSFNHNSIYTANSGRFFCTWQTLSEGCPYYYYRAVDGTGRLIAVTDCVTERANNGLNDQPPRVTFVGRNYPPASDCPSSTIVPLTTDETTLTDAISTLPAVGTTAGSLGFLWSWYMLSPNFGYVWPGSQPEPYGTRDLLKAAVIMTDGEFNTVHFDGVISRDSTISGNNVRHESNAHNGLPYTQARAYCDAMKARDVGIQIYTVGFDIGRGTSAANIMNYCASSPAHYFPAANEAQLRAAFQQIARNISQLRLTQ